MAKIKKLTDFAVEDRPREKISKYGSAQLKTEELLQILIGSGNKNDDVRSLANKVSKLMESNNNINKEDLLKIKGLGEAKSSIILSAIELGKRYSGQIDNDLSMLDPENVYNELIEISNQNKEHFVILYLNNRDKAIKKETISIGTVSASMVHPREVFVNAISNNASMIIGVHNHPSGEITPSDADIKITKRLVEVGNILGIEFYDHIIIARSNRHNKDKQKWFSFRENYEEWWD